jgi:hypothetical protein
MISSSVNRSELSSQPFHGLKHGFPSCGQKAKAFLEWSCSRANCSTSLNATSPIGRSHRKWQLLRKQPLKQGSFSKSSSNVGSPLFTWTGPSKPDDLIMALAQEDGHSTVKVHRSTTELTIIGTHFCSVSFLTHSLFLDQAFDIIPIMVFSHQSSLIQRVLPFSIQFFGSS